MNGVKEAALTVCLALLITALVRYLAPEGLSQEMLRTVSGLFVLVTVAGALRGAAGVFSELQWENFRVDTTLSDTVRRQQMSAAERELYDYVCGLLQAAGVDYSEVHIFLQTTDNPEDGGIVLDRIRVEAAFEAQRERARSVLTELFPGVTVEVDDTDE